MRLPRKRRFDRLSVRVVVEKPILGEKERWENKNGNGATYEEIGKETVFDKVIQIK